jgi:hypothetical protein
MQVFDYNELTQNVAKVFDAALMDEVIINNKDGYSYKILPFKNNNTQEKSPLGTATEPCHLSDGLGEGSPLADIPCIEANITTQEIVELLRESRAGI